MPYLPFDIDAKRKAAMLAKAVGADAGSIVWGLLELWEHVWRSKSDTVPAMLVAGCFGPDGNIRDGLVTYGFLEPVPDGYRVRGAGRWLLGLEGKSRGGKAAKTNLIPGAAHRLGSGSASAEAVREVGQESGDGLGSSSTHADGPNQRGGEDQPKKADGQKPASSASAEDQPKRSSRSPSALTASSQQPVFKASAAEGMTAAAFFARIQAARHEHGLPTDRPTHPAKLSSWYAAAIAELGGDEERLWDAYERWSADPHWRKANYPFAAFMTQWSDHVRPRAAAAS